MESMFFHRILFHKLNLIYISFGYTPTLIFIYRIVKKQFANNPMISHVIIVELLYTNHYQEVKTNLLSKIIINRNNNRKQYQK